LKIGVDIGSTAVKMVFIKEDEVIWENVSATVPGQGKLVETMISQGLDTLSLERSCIEKIYATGYGRKLIADTDSVVDEISANACGAFLLSGRKAHTIINIGGQDVKIIRISSEGKVTDFKMNDKCAAGTGRFFEMAARIIDTPLSEFGDLSLNAGSSVSINSTCAVFAESEIVSLLADGRNKEQIVKGLHESVAKRIVNMIGSMDLGEYIFIDGGPAMNPGLVECIENELLSDVHVLPSPQFTVAYGAAMIFSL
jgi:(R)-2-hydroxyacyl-CoA dehydratese activating ATPase